MYQLNDYKYATYDESTTHICDRACENRACGHTKFAYFSDFYHSCLFMTLHIYHAIFSPYSTFNWQYNAS